MINKIGSFTAHAAACGVAIAGLYLKTNFVETMVLAIFVETMAIYFNTKK